MERCAVAMLDTDDQRCGFGTERAAGLAPKLAVLRHQHGGFEEAHDFGNEKFQRRRGHARIDRRKAAADIEHVENHTGTDDRALHHVEGRGERRRCDGLAAHMEAGAQALGGLTGAAHEIDGIVAADAEFGGQRNFGMRAGHRQPNAQRHVTGTGRGFDDLVQFGFAVEGKNPNAMVEIGFGYGLGRFHRMHETERGFGPERAHQACLLDRGDVEMFDAAARQCVDEPGGRVGLYGVKALAREMRAEPSGRAGRCRGADAENRILRIN